MNTTPLSPNYQAIEDARSDDAITLEAINHELTVWFCTHPEFADEITEYKTAQRYLETIAGDDDLADTVLKLTLAKDTFRMVFGRNWEAK